MRTRRRQLGLSQSDLAERLGVSFQQVQKYERGANRVAASTLFAAAQALGTTSAGWSARTCPGREDDEDVFRALARPGALEILQAFNAIPDARDPQRPCWRWPGRWRRPMAEPAPCGHGLAKALDHPLSRLALC